MGIVGQDCKSFRVFSGNSNPVLAGKVCRYLGVPLGSSKIERFSDGEVQIEVNDNVRGRDVFVIQSTCFPVNDNLLELLLMVDALKRASANGITAVLPYYGYARQDKKVAPRVPISAKLIADLLTTAGVTRVITMDLHAGQIQGFFDVPVDNLYAAPVVYEHVNSNFDSDHVVIVSPDAGGVDRARAFAGRFGCELAIIDKRRSAPNEAIAMAVIGDVHGKIAIIQDDMVDTAGTLTEAARALLERGARDIHVCCTHPVLSGCAVDRIMSSPISSVVVTDTIPLGNEALNCSKIRVLSIANLLGEAILRSITGASVTSLFV